jgi:DNA polymerase III subunit epsilon
LALGKGIFKRSIGIDATFDPRMEIILYLFFDTETTGIPKNYKAPVSDLKNWPRMVQVAWLLTDESGAEISSAEHILKPNGYTIPADAARVHGITTEIAIECGVEIGSVLKLMATDIVDAKTLIAHNMAFDEKILGAEFLRAGFENYLDSKSRRCTMQAATDFCRLPGPYGFKWPTLNELHQKLFRESFSGAHQALVDVRACAKCFFELRKLKVM